ncbi:hypothetical protein SOVF_089030 isoform B [Spinacia oleracea]|uniref:Uncharacterized protein isoform X2 n=1 Tax=Spinacia oleracea TaxID=3562 RepID=A0A9R0INI1_SPIOL|nr:uncharacterized protein LOC110792121 isoform X2 [Spinacia oleracea]KNA16432.1 hypothetical protein SOVF_089030 isoform B [Spinacia oleracea]
MKKKHLKFKPLKELYDHGDTLTKSKAVGLFKVSPKESTMDQVSVMDPSQETKVKSHRQLPPSDEAKVEHQDKDVFECQGDDNSCISKDDGAIMITSDQFGGADNMIVTSRAASVSSPCPDVLEKPWNGPSIRNGSPIADNTVVTSKAASISSPCPDVLEKPLNGPSIRNGSPIATTQDPPLHNQNINHGDEPDELVDVKVCDICGDVGREALLVVCSKCSDGAEHIYCMSPKMENVPEGDWFCEECLLMQDPKRQRQVMLEISDNTLKPSCSKELSRVSPIKNSAIQHDGKMKRNKGIVDASVEPLKISGFVRKPRLTSLKKMNKGKIAARQVSSFVDLPGKITVKQACSSDHRSHKPEQQSCGGSFNIKKRVDSKYKKNAVCELKKDHHDKMEFNSLSLTGASSIPPDVSNTQSSVSNIKGVRYGCEKNSTENSTNQAGLPFVRYSSRKGGSSRTKVVPKIVKAAYLPKKNAEDKTAIQVNGNTNVKELGSVVDEGKNCVKSSAGSVEESKSPCHSSYVINSPAKNDNAYPDIMSLSTLKPELDNTHSVATYKVLPLDFLHMKSMPTLDSVDIDHMVPDVTSAVPESRCIWNGAFKLEKNGKLPTDCNGVQAHLSTSASSKIAELVIKFSDELVLKEVPRLLTWPIQFQKKYPTEQDIALYFFAQDLCSYEKGYRMLLEGMTHNDLALEANFGGFQLLVFPSSLLPVRSQGWNSLPFLWGVFRVRNLDDFQIPSLNIATVNQGYLPVTCGSNNKFISALVSGSGSALHTSDDSMNGPKLANPVVSQSSALIKYGDQFFEHEVPSLKRSIGTLKNDDAQVDIISFARDWRREDSGGALRSFDLQKGNRFTTGIGLCSEGSYKDPSFTQVDNSASDFWQRHQLYNGSSLSLGSGPSRSSDGGGCAKSAEDPSNYNSLDLDLCLGSSSSGSEKAVNLDLALGFTSKSKYKPNKDLLKDGNNRDKNVSLVLSLGMPCSTN